MSECESLLAECRDNLAVAVRRATEAEARIAALEAGLRDLTAEVRGNWEIDEAGLRSVLGHTNYTCVQRRVNEARALLRAPKEER